MAEDEIEEELDERFSEYERRIDEAVRQVDELLDSPAAQELRAELERLADELSAAQEEAENTAAWYEAELELPDPDVEDPDLAAIDWLLAPGRSYVEQVNAYRRREPIHRRRPPLVITERPPCLWCGEDVTHLGPRARFCNNNHRARYYQERGKREAT